LVFFALLIAARSLFCRRLRSGARVQRKFAKQGAGRRKQAGRRTNALGTFINDNEGWRCVAHTVAYNQRGSAWTPLPTGAEAARGFTQCGFWDHNTGWAGGASVIARTLDAGRVGPSNLSYQSISNNVSHKNSFFPSPARRMDGGEARLNPLAIPVGTEIL